MQSFHASVAASHSAADYSADCSHYITLLLLLLLLLLLYCCLLLLLCHKHVSVSNLTVLYLVELLSLIVSELCLFFCSFTLLKEASASEQSLVIYS